MGDLFFKFTSQILKKANQISYGKHTFTNLLYTVKRNLPSSPTNK